MTGVACLLHSESHRVIYSNTVANLAIRRATERLYFILPYNACSLSALDKCPGVRPIGIEEVLRRIMGRTSYSRIKEDLRLLGGNLQICLGLQICGIEHAIHALRDSYDDSGSDAILLIDAQKAFNSLNRDLALKNIEQWCRSLYMTISNSYREPTDLFINGRCIKSQEGTTHSDPLAMKMYGIAKLPLMERVREIDVMQKWYAEDGNAAGSIDNLKKTRRNYNTRPGIR